MSKYHIILIVMYIHTWFYFKKIASVFGMVGNHTNLMEADMVHFFYINQIRFVIVLWLKVSLFSI